MVREQRLSWGDLQDEVLFLNIVDADMPRVGNPRIWIVGGYKGKTAQALTRVWPHCSIELWEPQEWAAQEADRACAAHYRVLVHHRGLGSDEMQGVLPLGEYETDACSMLQEPTQRNWAQGTGHFVDVAVAASNTQPVHLTIMNCEGGEYVILPRLRQANLLWKFKWLLIQWHKVYVDDERVCDEMRLLNESHEKIERDGEVGTPDINDVTWTLWRLR